MHFVQDKNLTTEQTPKSYTPCTINTEKEKYWQIKKGWFLADLLVQIDC